MATPQPGYPPNTQPDHEQYQHEQDDPNQQQIPPAPTVGGRRKRNYAGQAYDFGAGANSALGGQQQGGGAYPGPPGMPPQPQPQPGYAAPAYGSHPASPGMGGAPGYGQSHPFPAVGGYQPPDPAYPTHGAPSSQTGMAGVTQGMSNLAMGGQGQNVPLPIQGHVQGRPAMNPLIPTDLLNQRLDFSELSRPPPSINLPPNVSVIWFLSEPSAADLSSPVSPLLQMLTAPQNMSARRLTLSQRRTRYSRNLNCPSHWSYNLIAHCTTTRTQFR